LGWDGVEIEIKKSELTKEQHMSKASKALKRRAALNKGKKCFVVGGDNSAECEISRMKGQL
jgi:hypothetical protein